MLLNLPKTLMVVSYWLFPLSTLHFPHFHISVFRFPFSHFTFPFPISVFRFPFSVFRFPFSHFTFHFSVFRFPFSVFSFHISLPAKRNLRYSFSTILYIGMTIFDLGFIGCKLRFLTRLTLV